MKEVMKKIWQDVLKLELMPDEDESFFDLGGNSYLAAQICQDFEEETGKSIEITDFYEYETIAKLIDSVGKSEEE
ncbi:MAG: acyl carrier protein [Oscillospiraceae bacterium]|nr:acyl carrier protein [Oscillospiraceae bacterium]